MKTRLMTNAPLHGDVAPGFEAVHTAFARNFTERGELGAACTIYYRGEKVVDLWGGYRDPQKQLPWQEDTMVLVFSSTKGLAGLAMALAHSRGLFDYDAPIASYWPEFAHNGKEHITVRQLLAHEAGLCSIDEPLPPAVLANPDADVCPAHDLDRDLLQSRRGGRVDLVLGRLGGHRPQRPGAVLAGV